MITCQFVRLEARAVAAATGPGFKSRQPDFPELEETSSVGREVCEDGGDSEVRQLAGSSQRGFKRADGDFSFCCKPLLEKYKGVF